jgi:epoxyqueuosine reductase
VDSASLRQIALESGFDLAGVTNLLQTLDFERFARWRAEGLAGSMGYLTDRRGDLRADVRNLLPSARSVLCVGKWYKGPEPDVTRRESGSGWVSCYAWGEDYHEVLRAGLEQVVQALRDRGISFEHKICVDTAPLLERSLAREAGLGWIGKNTCLINQERGSWFFLGELLLSIEVSPGELDAPPPDRCGTCTRCIDACPTVAFVPDGQGRWMLDARRCISYLTIEHRGPTDESLRESTGAHIFGCDICQDVCPWNARSGGRVEMERSDAFEPQHFQPDLGELLGLDEAEFRARFAGSPILRSKYAGFLRNVLTAVGNEPNPKYLPVVERLTGHPDEGVARHARWALRRLERCRTKTEALVLQPEETA